MPACAISTCKNTVKNTKGKNVSFFRFPRKATLQKVWLRACRRADYVNKDNAVICSQHFLPEEIQGTLAQELLKTKVKRSLLPNAVPTLMVPSVISKAVNPKCDSVRDQRNHKRDVKRRIVDRLNALSPKKISLIQPSATETLCERDNVCDSNIPCERDNVCDSNFRKHNLKKKLSKMEKKYKELEDTHKQTLKKMKVLERRGEAARIQKGKLLAKLASATKLCSVQSKNTASKIQEMFKGTLSRAQIRFITSKRKQGRWGKEDILKALSLRALSKKSYMFVRKKMSIPLPGLTTLQRWTKDFQTPPGILFNVLEMMKAMELSDFEKCSILSFDEMNIDSRISYDHQSDTVYGPFSNVQVVMVRGIFNSWKQPVYYDFDRQITKTILLDIINHVENVGYHVVACVSDLGGKNTTVWKCLNINEHSPSFPNPKDASRRIWVFADIPHLIKLLRNHTLDEGILLESGTVLSTSVFREVLEKDSGEFKLCPKLSELHLSCSGRERQRVYLATQLFSIHTAEALRRLNPQCTELADFIALVNDFFDVFNSSIRLDNTVSLRSGFGTNIKKQSKVLLDMRRACTRMRVKGKITLLPFQKGILLSIAALFGLFKDLSSTGVKFILTRRLNQDCLEHFFSQVRGLGRFYDHPLPTEFKNRMRLLLIGTNIECLKLKTCAQDEDEEKNSFMITETMFMGLTEGVADPSLDEDEEIRIFLSEEFLSDTNQNSLCRRKLSPDQLACEKEGMRYVAGYVAHRCIDVDPTLGTRTGTHVKNTTSWINAISKTGGLMEPSVKWMGLVEEFEVLFVLHNGGSLNTNPKIIGNFQEILQAKYPSLHPKVIKVYSRTRTFIRLKFLNKENIAAARVTSAKNKAAKWVKSGKITN